MGKIVKNRLYFKRDTGKKIIITSIVNMKGSKEVVVYVNSAYGQVSERLVFSYNGYEEFCNNLSLKQPIIKEVMSKEKEGTKTVRDLKNTLYDVIDLVKSNDIDVKSANSIANLSQKIINIEKLKQK